MSAPESVSLRPLATFAVSETLSGACGFVAAGAGAGVGLGAPTTCGSGVGVAVTAGVGSGVLTVRFTVSAVAWPAESVIVTVSGTV